MNECDIISVKLYHIKLMQNDSCSVSESDTETEESVAYDSMIILWEILTFRKL